MRNLIKKLFGFIDPLDQEVFSKRWFWAKN